jgi:hypothetical protein
MPKALEGEHKSGLSEIHTFPTLTTYETTDSVVL